MLSIVQRLRKDAFRGSRAAWQNVPSSKSRSGHQCRVISGSKLVNRSSNNSLREYHLLPSSISVSLEHLIENACRTLFPDAQLSNQTFNVGTSPIGDYKTNIAFQIAPKVKKKPTEVAQLLTEAVNKSTMAERKLLSSAEATGPGFVSFILDTTWLVHQSTHQDVHKLRARKYERSRRIIIDHGSPNMSKEFHVGHLRSILIGDCLARILRYQGHHVETVSHVGDYGTPMALVVAQAIRSRAWASSPDSELAELPTPSELSALYVEAKAAQKTDSELQALTTRCLQEIQRLDRSQADPHITRVYNIICEASRKGFDEVYRDLGVNIPEKGESFYGPMIPSTIEELKAKNLLSESDGAMVCQLESWKAPLLVEKSDKSWLYGTTDLACLRYRLQVGNFDDIFYVVDFTQNQHFEQVFEVGRKAGWYDPKNVRVDHVYFGVVQGSNGQKLSSRDGTPLTLRQLLDDAVVETRAALIAARSLVRSDRQDQEAEPISLDEKLMEPTRIGTVNRPDKSGSEVGQISPASLALAEENSQKVAYNAIKYFELSQTRTQNYIFSFQSMLSLKGNTSFYIIYAYARIQTLYRRAQEQGIAIPSLSTDDTLELTEAEIAAITNRERDLALKILQFPDVVREAETLLMPHVLSAHLFQTAQKFHGFYENCRVIGSTNQDFRFKLCQATERMLQTGLELLNVQVLNHV